MKAYTKTGIVWAVLVFISVLSVFLNHPVQADGGTWWNSDWQKCRNITISASGDGDVNKSSEMILANLTGLTFSSTNEIRVVNNYCHNGGNEVPSHIASNGSDWAEAWFDFDKQEGTNTTYSVYYDSPGASAPDYSGTTGFSVSGATDYVVAGNGFKYSLDASMGAWSTVNATAGDEKYLVDATTTPPDTGIGALYDGQWEFGHRTSVTDVICQKQEENDVYLQFSCDSSDGHYKNMTIFWTGLVEESVHIGSDAPDRYDFTFDERTSGATFYYNGTEITCSNCNQQASSNLAMTGGIVALYWNYTAGDNDTMGIFFNSSQNTAFASNNIYMDIAGAWHKHSIDFGLGTGTGDFGTNSDFTVYYQAGQKETSGCSGNACYYSQFIDLYNGFVMNPPSVTVGTEEEYAGGDTAFPSVTLTSPANAGTESSPAVAFNCSATDAIDIDNATLYGNWSGGWHANATNTSVDGTWDFAEFSKTLMDGDYTWNCYWCDNSSNCAFATSNYTFTLETPITPSIELVSPTFANGSFTNSSDYIEINVSSNATLSQGILSIDNINYSMSCTGTWCYLNFTNLGSDSVLGLGDESDSWTKSADNPLIRHTTYKAAEAIGYQEYDTFHILWRKNHPSDGFCRMNTTDFTRAESTYDGGTEADCNVIFTANATDDEDDISVPGIYYCTRPECQYKYYIFYIYSNTSYAYKSRVRFYASNDWYATQEDWYHCTTDLAEISPGSTWRQVMLEQPVPVFNGSAWGLLMAANNNNGNPDTGAWYKDGINPCGAFEILNSDVPVLKKADMPAGLANGISSGWVREMGNRLIGFVGGRSTVDSKWRTFGIESSSAGTFKDKLANWTIRNSNLPIIDVDKAYDSDQSANGKLITATNEAYPTYAIYMAINNSFNTETVSGMHTNYSINELWGAGIQDIGELEFTVYVESSTNDWNSTVRTYDFGSGDTTPPAITIDHPTNRSYNSARPDINVTVSEGASWCGYIIGTGSNVTMSGSGTDWHAQNTTMPEGFHHLYVYCNDTVGNMALNDSIWFTYDATPPAFTWTVSNSTLAANVTTISWRYNLSELIGTYCYFDINGTNHTGGIYDDMYPPGTAMSYCLYQETSILTNATHCATGHADDMSGNVNSTSDEVCITTNIIYETMTTTIASPLSGSYSYDTHTLSVSTDVAADTCQYAIGTGSNVTMSGSGTSWSAPITISGTQTVTVWCQNGTLWDDTSISLQYTTGGGGGGGGYECYTDSQCLPGEVCVNYVCTTELQECYTDSDCPAGEFCKVVYMGGSSILDNHCTPYQCDLSRDCGEWCDLTDCTTPSCDGEWLCDSHECLWQCYTYPALNPLYDIVTALNEIGSGDYMTGLYHKVRITPAITFDFMLIPILIIIALAYFIYRESSGRVFSKN